MKKISVIFLVIIIALFANKLYSQELKANVVVNMEQLTFESRTNVSTMESDLRSYINNQKFTDLEWEGDPIPVDITVYLSGGANNQYSARLLIISRRNIDGPESEASQTIVTKFYDAQWSFQYNMGASLTYNPLVFDSFRTLIDYYMLLVIGCDMDTYSEAGGSKIFDQAKSLLLLGASQNAAGYNTFSQPGEFTRFNLVTELCDLRYEEFRSLVFSYHVDGLDKISFDREKGLQALDYIIADMADFKKNRLVGPSVLMQLFFDSKSHEIAVLFNGYKNNLLFQNLIYLDPTNSSLYQDAKEGKTSR